MKFNFPKNRIEFIRGLKEEEILRLIELEQIRIDDKNRRRGERKWIKECLKSKALVNYILKGKHPKMAGTRMMFYYFIRGLGSFLRNHKEFTTKKIVEEMDKTRTMSYFASPLKAVMTNAGVPSVEVERYDVNAKRVKDIENMQLMYYDNLSLIIAISNDLLKKLKKLSHNKDAVKKMSIKDLSQVIQKLVNAMSMFKQKQQNNTLVNINLANAKREDYWHAFNKVQSAFEDEQI